MSMKKLYKSNDNDVWTGTLGGIGEWLDVDAVILRILMCLFTVMMGLGCGLIIYAILALCIPNKDDL